VLAYKTVFRLVQYRYLGRYTPFDVFKNKNVLLSTTRYRAFKQRQGVAFPFHLALERYVLLGARFVSVFSSLIIIIRFCAHLYTKRQSIEWVGYNEMRFKPTRLSFIPTCSACIEVSNLRDI